MAKRKTNIFVSLVVVAIMLVVCCSQVVAYADVTAIAGDKITVYNWAEYIYPDWEDDFREYYKDLTGRDIAITYVTFDTNETMLNRILRGDSTVDVICPSEYAIEKLITAGKLMPINYFDNDTPYSDNSGNINQPLLNKVSEAFDGYSVGGKEVDIMDYLVPYMWGTIGVLYNVDVIEEAGLTKQDMIDSGWGALYNKDSNGDKLSTALDNRIFMKDSVRDAYAATLCYMYDNNMLDDKYMSLTGTELINSIDNTLLPIAKEVLAEQKKILYGYEVDFGKDDLIKGNVYVDLAWSGDAMYAIEEGELYDVALDYYIPETSNVWLDGWVIPTGAKNLEPARIFIDFMNKPYVSAQNMMEIGYTSAVDKEVILGSKEAMKVLTEVYNVYAPQYWEAEDGNEFDFESVDEFIEYFFTDTRYPDASNERLGVMRDFGSNADKVSQMWESVKSMGLSTIALFGYTVLVMAVVTGVLYLAWVIHNRRKMYVIVGSDNDNN